jgi:outer membrane lipoprotein SlyB
MYFFVSAGILLTYLTNNRKVFEVVAVSHVSAVLITGFAFDQSMTGTTAAAYGLLAATAVRAAYVGASSRRYSQKTQTAAPTGIFALSAVGMLMIGVVSGGLVQNVPLIVGFVAGGVLECLRVVSKTRGTSKGEMNEMDAIGTSSSR